MLTKCSFCSEFGGEGENNLFEEIIKPKLDVDNRIVFETEYWYIVPTIGGFIPGYYLIVSKEHQMSVGWCSEKYYFELEALVKSIDIYIKRKYKLSTVMFEHGLCSPVNRGGCCVEHAHIHVVPYEGDLINSVNKGMFEIKAINEFVELKRQVEEGNAYLFYQNNSAERYIIQGEYIPSQYFRQIIAQKLNLSHKWDWRINHELDNLLNCIKQFDKIEMEKIYCSISRGFI